jgi:hypothetical protein
VRTVHLIAPYRRYIKEIHDRFGFWATWLPNEAIQLGDVGPLVNLRFQRVTNLQNQGIAFNVEPPGNSAEFQYASSNSVTIQVKAKGELPLAGSVLAQTDAGISVSFANKNATMFLATKCRVSSIAKQDDLAKTIIQRAEHGDWPREHLVVTSVVQSDASVILISSGDSGKVEFAVAGSAPVSPITLVGMQARVREVHASNVDIRIVSKNRLTPLFRVQGLRKKLFGGTYFAPSGGGFGVGDEYSTQALDDASDAEFGGITYDDFPE